MLPERGDEPLAFAADAAQAVSGPARKAPEITSAEVGPCMLLPVGPEILHGVKFGRIGWPAAGEDFALQGFEVLAEGRGAMDRRAVPDDEQLAGQMALQVTEEPG